MLSQVSVFENVKESNIDNDPDFSLAKSTIWGCCETKQNKIKL